MATVAVIGTGPSGLVATKSLVEHGLDPVVFEAATSIGGMWGGPGRGAWSSSARTNLSFFSCGFSDSFWPAQTEIFPYRKEIINYLERFAAEFDLFDHIKFKRRIYSVKSDVDGQWRVDYFDERSEKKSAVFDNVVVATGFFTKPFVPHFAGLSDFQGELFHSADCDSPGVFRDRFHGKRVLVVGAAFSGTEIAAQMVQFAKTVTVTFRKPMWFMPRWISPAVGEPRYPLDLVFYNRRNDNPLMRDPRNFLKHIAGDPGAVSPELAFDQDAELPLTMVITDEFLDQVRANLLSVKRTAELKFDATGAVFSDGTRQDFDAVVMCTGFTSDLPFFGPDLLKTIGFSPTEQFQPTLLHRHLFHPDLPGLAFVGQYRGPYFPVMELQSRWISRIIAGELAPPSREEMLMGIEDERRLRNQFPRPQFPHGDFVGLADGLAREVGVYPQLDEHHPLYEYIENGPVVPAHFRLVGPHAKPEGAVQAILATPTPLMEKKDHANLE
jgi:dimethylaniline monooxygenase (N-oxide forming)